jgi:hypothetical protein
MFRVIAGFTGTHFYKWVALFSVSMARTCHTEGMRERQRMKNHSRKGKHDLGWIGDNGGWNHICRYPTEEKAQEAKIRLSNPSKEEQNLIGIPADPTLEIISR